jgi:hypothetical protein
LHPKTCLVRPPRRWRRRSAFFLGAEFTQVHARRYGSGIRPDSHAITSAGKRDDEDKLLDPAAKERQVGRNMSGV